jgi:dTDP-4-dehydrorhamnose reductase
MKTMLRLASERDKLSVVNDQIGTPTNAVELAEVLVKIINEHSKLNTEHFGIYNFSNEGQCSWYDFAKKIFEIITSRLIWNQFQQQVFQHQQNVRLIVFWIKVRLKRYLALR